MLSQAACWAPSRRTAARASLHSSEWCHALKSVHPRAAHLRKPRVQALQTNAGALEPEPTTSYSSSSEGEGPSEMEEGKRKLRILCLHGYTQNASVSTVSCRSDCSSQATVQVTWTLCDIRAPLERQFMPLSRTLACPQVFKSRIGSMRKALKSRVEFLFMDAPHFPKAENDADLQAAGGTSSGRTWWHWEVRACTSMSAPRACALFAAHSMTAPGLWQSPFEYLDK